jgi:peptide/nickel transport system permease protein
MAAFLLQRALTLGLTLIAATMVIFVMLEVVPGDPALTMMGLEAAPEAVEALRRELGLDAPPLERYLAWVGGMLRGDFGLSYTYRTPVSELIADRIAVSLPLTLYALALSTLIALPAGVLAATRRGGPADLAVTAATQIGLAVPNFWFAMLLVLLFASVLQMFSAGGFPG